MSLVSEGARFQDSHPGTQNPQVPESPVQNGADQWPSAPAGSRPRKQHRCLLRSILIDVDPPSSHPRCPRVGCTIRASPWAQQHSLNKFTFQHSLVVCEVLEGRKPVCPSPGTSVLGRVCVSSRDTTVSHSQVTRPSGVRMRVVHGGWGTGPRDTAAYLREKVTLCMTQHRAAREEGDAQQQGDSARRRGQGAAPSPDWGVGLHYVPFNRGTDVE